LILKKSFIVIVQVVLSKAIVSELETSKLDERLNASISRGVAKSLKYFAVKSENMLATEAEAYQVRTSPVLDPASRGGLLRGLWPAL
jgi:hypothetical protein